MSDEVVGDAAEDTVLRFQQSERDLRARVALLAAERDHLRADLAAARQQLRTDEQTMLLAGQAQDALTAALRAIVEDWDAYMQTGESDAPSSAVAFTRLSQVHDAIGDARKLVK